MSIGIDGNETDGLAGGIRDGKPLSQVIGEANSHDDVTFLVLEVYGGISAGVDANGQPGSGGSAAVDIQKDEIVDGGVEARFHPAFRVFQDEPIGPDFLHFALRWHGWFGFFRD